MLITSGSFRIATPIFLGCLIIFGSLLGSEPIVSDYLVRKMHTFPKWVAQAAFLGYASIIILSAALGSLLIVKRRVLPRTIIILGGAFTIPLVWAVVTNSDQVRYVVILTSIVCCPTFLSKITTEQSDKKIANLIRNIFVVFLLLSAFYSWLNFNTHPRVSGYHANSNLMGMWLVSFLALFLYYGRHISPTSRFSLLLFAAVLVVLSGSRLTFVSFCILLAPSIWKHKAIMVILVPILIFSYIFLLDGVELDYRVLQVATAVSDSGRSGIWEHAVRCVSQQPFVGHGMHGGIECVGRGNIHNSYLRIVAMMGGPLSIAFWGLYFAAIIRIIFVSRSPYIKGYFLIVLLALTAEDYVVGFGTPFFMFFLIFLSLHISETNYKLDRSDSVSEA